MTDLARDRHPRLNPVSRTENKIFRPARTLIMLLLVMLLAAQPVLGAPPAEPTSGQAKTAHVAVQAFANRTAIAPGETMTLAVRLAIDEDWHIYWQNPGSLTGLPTEISWTVPEGFKIGPTLYPRPKTYTNEALNEVSYILEDEAIFLTTVTAPDTLPEGQGLAFTARATWLACQKNCVPGDALVTLKVPTVKAGGGTAAHEEFFEDALIDLPVPLSEAERFSISVSADKTIVKPGDTFNVLVTTEIKPKHHMQGHKVYLDGMIATMIFLYSTPGLEFEETIYPPDHETIDKVLGKLTEYSGKQVFKIPVKVADDAGNAARWVRGVFRCQICLDAGSCFATQHVAIAVPVQIEGGPAPTTLDAYLASLTPAHLAGKSAEQVTSESAAAATTPGAGAAPATSTTHKNILTRAQEALESWGLIGVLIGAFIGGFVLNLMPCVLPVISLKVLSFVRQAHEDRWRIFKLGLVYGLGIEVFYIVLAVLVFSFNIGWGQLFQNTTFVIVMAGIMLAFSMSLFGVFVLFTPKIVNELGQKAEAQEGYLSAFGTGLLATLLGTACTAPFLSAAIGYATQQDALEGGLIFVMVGLGMASPFILLAYNPAWLKFVPKPGNWMVTFEHIMGFLLLGTMIWLLNPLRSQIGAWGMLLTLMFLLAVAIAAWLKGKIQFGDSPTRKLTLYGAVLAILLIGWYLPFGRISTIDELEAEQIKHMDLIAQGEYCYQMHSGESNGELVFHGWAETTNGIPWQHYRSREQVEQYVKAGYTVLVDYTADWCASCKTNLKTSIDTESTIAVMRELNVVPFEADYTIKRPVITADLKRFGKAGVPMYLVYKPHDIEAPEQLPELLTPGIVIDALKRAGPSQPTTATDKEAESESDGSH